MLTIWRPRSLSRWESLFDEFFENRELSSYFETHFSPDIDIIETPDELILEAELPGLVKQDVKILYENGALKISGEKKFEEAKEDEFHHRIERSYGQFFRIIPINEEYIKPDEIKAEMHNGLLKIEIPKSKEVVGKEIEVEIK